MRYDYNACYLHLKISLSGGIQYPDNDIFFFLIICQFYIFYIFFSFTIDISLIIQYNKLNKSKTTYNSIKEVQSNPHLSFLSKFKKGRYSPIDT